MKGKVNASKIAMMIFITALSLIALFPFYSMAIMGTYYANDLYTGIKLLPGNYLRENLKTLMSVNIGLYYKNSMIVAITSSLLCVFVCSLAGFGFAKYDFRFKKLLFGFVLATLMIPTQLSLVAFVIEMRKLGWMNTLLPLIVPQAASPFGAFWMTKFAVGAIPTEVLESGRIDGCSEFQLYYKIALPFLRPACVTLGLLAFLWSWNSFLTPLVIISKDELFTIPLGIRQLATYFRSDSAAQILGLSITTLPILIFFAIFSKNLITGLASAALKD